MTEVQSPGESDSRDSIWQQGFIRRSVKQALVGLPLMFVAIAFPIIAKACHFTDPAWEAARTATALFAGLGWYAIWRPHGKGNVGAKLLGVFWVTAGLFWVGVFTNSTEHRQVVMESFAISVSVLAVDMTLREVLHHE